MNMLVDTSILVRLSNHSSSIRQVCEQAVLLAIEQDCTLALCAQVLIEYWAVSTRPAEANGLGRSIQVTYEDCTDYLFLMSLLEEPPDIAQRWLELVRRYEVKGKEVHDARLVAFSAAHGIPHILTLNPADFSRYQEVTAITPAKLIERLSAGG
jgi:predicted nucleic acid-binding protein